MKKTTQEIQRALIKLGYNLGKGGPSGKGDDNIAGSLTRQALITFQSTNGLSPTGVADARTLAKLFPAEALSPLSASPPWLDVAKALKGTTEIVGPKNNPTIMRWAEKLGLWYPNDETAWCGLFVAHCISTALPQEPQPSNPLGARNWQKFGIELKQPAPGAIMVFWRGTKAGWQGHVGFHLGERRRDGALRILGGNQSNTVREDWLDRARLLSIRWTAYHPLPTGDRVYLADNGQALSSNEA